MYDSFEENDWTMEWETEDLLDLLKKPFVESFFSRGKPVLQLERCIIRCPETLQDVIAENYGIFLGVGHDRKKLIKQLKDVILDEFVETFLNLKLEDIHLLLRLAAGECSIKEVSRSFDLVKYGFVFNYLDEKEEYVIPVVPQEIAERAVKTVDEKDFFAELAFRDMFKRALRVCVRLYGVFDKKILYQRVSPHMEEDAVPGSEEKLVEILSRMYEDSWAFDSEGGYVFDPDLEEDYEERFSAMGDKPYYDFSENEWEFYQNHYVDIHSKAYIALMRYLRGKTDSEEDADKWMEELSIEAVEELGGIFSVPEIVERYEIPFTSEDDLNQFERLFRNWEDSVRKWNNRGFTNQEMQEHGETGSYAVISWNLEKLEFADVKPNPDAPCPCGSGKRYRQCCGRK